MRGCLNSYIIYCRQMMRKYFQDYESEEDEDYNPTKQEQALYRQEHERKRKIRLAEQTTLDLYNQMREEYELSVNKKVKPSEEITQSPLEIAEKILNSESMKPNKRVMFAGKEFMLNEETGQLEIIEKKQNYELLEQHHHEQNPEQFQRRKTHIAYQYLNHVMRAIYNRSRKINSVGKSKLDWKGFVKQEGIEDKLKYNRKGGVIQNMHFIKKTNLPTA